VKRRFVSSPWLWRTFTTSRRFLLIFCNFSRIQTDDRRKSKRLYMEREHKKLAGGFGLSFPLFRCIASHSFAYRCDVGGSFFLSCASCSALQHHRLRETFMRWADFFLSSCFVNFWRERSGLLIVCSIRVRTST
jgi:hypothetical protein